MNWERIWNILGALGVVYVFVLIGILIYSLVV